MELLRYTGPIWRGEELAPALGDALARPDHLIELAWGEGPALVLGVPHHAPPGVAKIARERADGGRVADENAVLYALVCYAALVAHGVACRLVVACQARDHDPNKDEASPYCRSVLERPARLLLECHGAGRRAPHDLELSAGRNGRARPLAFGRVLAAALGPGFPVAVQTRPGTREALRLEAQQRGTPCELRFPALRTRSLLAAARRGLPALHLEAKPRYRSAGPDCAVPTPPGRRLGDALARTLAALPAPEPAPA